MEFGPLPAKDEWALDGTMSGTGRARQIWTGTGVSPTPPASAPMPPGTASPTSTPTSKRTEQRFETYRAEDADILVVSFGTTSVFVDRVVDELRAEGMSIGSFRPITLWPFPSVGSKRRPGGSSTCWFTSSTPPDGRRRPHVCHDRSVIRSIGGVSQDESGMRQGDLLNADEVSSADTPRRGRAVAARN